MRIASQDVVGKLTDYLKHRVSLPELVDWAEQAMMDGDFAGRTGKQYGILWLA